MNKIRLGFGFAVIAWLNLWLVINAVNLSPWTDGYWTGVASCIMAWMVGRLLEGVCAGVKEWRERTHE